MLTVEDALRAVLERAEALPPRSRRLVDAIGCALAEDVAADLDLPPFDKALVDGYAVRSADLAGGDRRLRVVGEIAAGTMPTRPIGPREAMAIMTGAPMPDGADAVVMIEQATRQGGEVVVEDSSVAPGRNRMARGREMQSGEVVLRRGDRLGPARVGLLASVGRDEVAVLARPRVAIVPTGDELVEPGLRPGPGQIRNSNAVMLRALVASCDADAEALPIAPDRLDPLRDVLGRGLSADVLLITGGVSAGNRDLVPEALASLGVARVFHKVRIKPGKPLWFGIGPPRPGAPGAFVFGLPGNPVSGVVGFLLFVRPLLDRLWSRTVDRPYLTRERLATSFAHAGDRPTYHPSRWSSGADSPDHRRVEPLDWAGSADLRTVARADGFAVFPAGDRTYEAGSTVDFLHWA